MKPGSHSKPTSHLCGYCGTPSPYLRPPGAVLVFRDNSAAEMQDLVAALTEPTELVCEVCEKPLPTLPTVIGLFTAPDDGRPLRVVQIVVPGTLEPSWDEYEDIARAHAYVDWSLVPIPEGYEIRELTVTTERAARDPQFEALNILRHRAENAERLAGNVVGSWRQLTAPVLAAAQLAGTTDEDLAAVEVTVWRQLLDYWSGVENDTLESLLDTDIGLYVKNPPTPAAVDALCEMTPPVEYIGLYAYQALRAYACLLSDMPNPMAAEWALVYLEHEDAIRHRPNWRVFAVSPRRARATISLEAARTAVSVAIAARFDNAQLDHPFLDSLQATLDDLGYGGLVGTVIAGMFDSSWRGTALEMLPVVDAGLHLDALLVQLSSMLLHATSENPVADLTAVAERIRTRYSDVAGSGAKVDNWLTRSIYRLADSEAALSHLDGSASPDHVELRAAALMHVGRHAEAVELLRPIVDDPALACTDVHDTATMVLAGAYEGTGAIDRALALVEGLYRDRPGYFEDLQPQYVLAMLQSNNGRHADALATLRRAEPFARTSTARAMIAASLAHTLYDMGDRTAALDIVLTLEPLEADETDVYWVGYIRVLARVWRNLIITGTVLPDAHVGRLDRVDTALATLSRLLGDVGAHAAGERAQLTEARGRAATDLYAGADASRQARGRARNPREVIEMARAAYERGDGSTGSQLFDEIAAAVSATVGDLDDPLIAEIELAPIGVRLTELAGMVWNDLAQGDGDASERWEALLTVGEMQRDVVHRIRSAGSGSEMAHALPDLSTAGLARLARPDGTFAVVSWFQLGVGRKASQFLHIVQPVVIIVRPDGSTGAWLPLPDEVPSRIQETVRRIQSRLTNWHDGRAGDPLDLPAWQEVAAWIRDGLAQGEIGERHHVVFMEYPDMAGAPWHTAIGLDWTASYAGSWSEIFNVVDRQAEPPGRTIGIVHVPRFNEPAAIRAALDASVKHTLRRHKLSRRVLFREPEHCDSDWLRTLLRDSDIVKILCHGFVSPAENEVCLMLAHQGALPMAGSLAADMRGLQHRFGWRDCRDITNSHATIFSAACSSRASVSTQAGDRLGIFAALRRSGARALVAPAWDVQAGPTVTLLDHALDLHVGGVPLARAVREAGDAADAAGWKPWIARSLAVEGDWH